MVEPCSLECVGGKREALDICLLYDHKLQGVLCYIDSGNVSSIVAEEETRSCGAPSALAHDGMELAIKLRTIYEDPCIHGELRQVQACIVRDLDVIAVAIEDEALSDLPSGERRVAN